MAHWYFVCFKGLETVVDLNRSTQKQWQSSCIVQVLDVLVVIIIRFPVHITSKRVNTSHSIHITTLIIGNKISDLLWTVFFCERNYASYNIVFSCCWYWKCWSLCFCIEMPFLDWAIVICQLTLLFVFNAYYQTSLLGGSLYFNIVDWIMHWLIKCPLIDFGVI